jgi:hypothetical protein
MDKESGVYLIYLGSFGELKDKFKILESPLVKYRSFNEDDGIYKFGKTVDLNKRVNQHKNHYEKIIGQRFIQDNFKVIAFKSMSCEKITEGEKLIKNFCLDRNFHFIDESFSNTNHNELVIVKKSDLNKLIEIY